MLNRNHNQNGVLEWRSDEGAWGTEVLEYWSDGASMKTEDRPSFAGGLLRRDKPAFTQLRRGKGWWNIKRSGSPESVRGSLTGKLPVPSFGGN